MLVSLLTPMALEQDVVDLREVDGLGAVSNGFEQSTEADVAQEAQDALGGAGDEGEASGVRTEWGRPARSSSAWTKSVRSSGGSLWMRTE